MNSSREYTRGLDAEAAVIKQLSLHKASLYDDLNLDIDAWTKDGSSISIKSQPVALRTGNLALETHVYDSIKEQWEESWALTGEADFTYFKVGETIYALTKKNKEYIVNNLDSLPQVDVKKLRPSTIASQHRIGHRHTDARLVVFPIRWALKQNLLHIVK